MSTGKSLFFIVILCTIIAVGGAFAEGASELELGASYVGGESCKDCHGEIYETFMKSGHPYKLNKVENGQPPNYPYTTVPKPPEGYTWDDITYVIGGYNWKARFIGKDGYIITGDKGDTDFLGQYNFANPIVGNDAEWAKYHPGEKRPYNCGSCHTTGYSNEPGTHQDGLEGLVGTWAEPGISCEECHGPGSLHVQNPRGVALKVDRDSESCGSCHFRGVPEKVDASGGFIKHHEQYEELFQSKHITLDCTVCHDPHAGVIALRKEGKPAVRVECANCHFEKIEYQKSPIMASVVKCIDCHMPRVTKSAVGNKDMFTGDLRTHLMAIDPKQIGQFSDDGSYALSQLGLNFACRSCHVRGGTASTLTDKELIETSYGYHQKPANL